MGTYYKECYVEQICHYAALPNWQNLNVGDSLILEYDVAHDKIKVKKDDFYLGELSDDDSKPMLPFLKTGWIEVFSVKLCLKSEIDSENKRIKIVIYLERK